MGACPPHWVYHPVKSLSVRRLFDRTAVDEDAVALRHHPHGLTQGMWASYIAKYKRLRAPVEDFDDQSGIEHLLAQLAFFYARKIAEAEAADGRVCPVFKVTCHDPVTFWQQIVQQMGRHLLYVRDSLWQSWRLQGKNSLLGTPGRSTNTESSTTCHASENVRVRQSECISSRDSRRSARGTLAATECKVGCANVSSPCQPRRPGSP